MRKSSLIIASVAAALLALPAMAQPGPGMGAGAGMAGGGAGPGMRAATDCTAATNPEQCKARQEAHPKVI